MKRFCFTAFLTVMVFALLGPATLVAGKPGTGGGSGFTYKKYTSPSRTVAKDSSGKVVATFTNGTRTVTLVGPSRTFWEATAADSVTHSTWVRLLSTPFSGSVNEAWLRAALADTSPDLLALAMQYIEGAPSIYTTAGLRIAGDSDYGPLQVDGTRQEGSDFNDYIGIDWTYPTSVDHPESAQIGSLDCSGFMRMIFGYRSGMPMSLDPDGGASLPRRSFQMHESAPGLIITSSLSGSTLSFSKLAPGDLVFFDASTDDGTQIDHVGMFLGLDATGHYRFVSSRKSINGPTLGDYKGKSLLDGTGLYATSFRAARRL